jgi:hypothetical protein
MRDLGQRILPFHCLSFLLVESRAHLDDARGDSDSNCERRNRSIDDRVGADNRPPSDRDAVENPDAGREPNVIADVNAGGNRTLLRDGDIGRVERMIGGDDNSRGRDQTLAPIRTAGAVQGRKTVNGSVRRSLSTQLAIDQYVVVDVGTRANLDASSLHSTVHAPSCAAPSRRARGETERAETRQLQRIESHRLVRQRGSGLSLIATNT